MEGSMSCRYNMTQVKYVASVRRSSRDAVHEAARRPLRGESQQLHWRSFVTLLCKTVLLGLNPVPPDGALGLQLPSGAPQSSGFASSRMREHGASDPQAGPLKVRSMRGTAGGVLRYR
ncbi:hypothetical protein NDU88_002996 [Pleurodeles waltl]|uniref:Uncharacterized protein n=1 Tax=Pleurodeles waltl TaxID=8319 RepID=A0AAV7W3Q8_PLEWA|nr:hypothetical protein NDU88_002996 [Pleurodeles waltl]